MTGTPDDVQRAARNLVNLDKAAAIDADKIYDALIEDGWTPPGAAAVTTSPEDWTPVPLRWRHVRVGDVAPDGHTLWMVNIADLIDGSVKVVTSHGDNVVEANVDPDEVVSVLCPATEANALARVRDELGGTVVDRTV